MSAKERRETEKRLQGATFRVYPDKSNEDVAEETKKEEVDDFL
ncbi:hypothetical protein TELCIR_06053 [Teladorsagia circumcincta]|uniref:Uncharacterized protein n=1 Tax=Teladorsagia circumcincta TaxID=45464 RepID=A0A2G9URC7_TELCI|nr:hypothetical protein TELCIR_06053 [Teladorsagia circumcincta]